MDRPQGVVERAALRKLQVGGRTLAAAQLARRRLGDGARFEQQYGGKGARSTETRAELMIGRGWGMFVSANFELSVSSSSLSTPISVLILNFFSIRYVYMINTSYCKIKNTLTVKLCK